MNSSSGNCSIATPPPRPPEQNGQAASFVSGSTNLNLRGFGSDQTVVLINGRRLPEVLTATSGVQPPDVNLIPVGLVQRVEVLPSSASALYSGNPVGGVINVVLRQNVNASEVTATYSNALEGFDAPQSTISLQHGESLLDGRLQLSPQCHVHAGRAPSGIRSRLSPWKNPGNPNSPTDPIYAATPNVHSANLSPLFGPGTSAETSVAPGADGSGDWRRSRAAKGSAISTCFKRRKARPGFPEHVGLPLRAQGNSCGTFFGSAVYDVLPWLQLGLDAVSIRAPLPIVASTC